MSRSPSRGSRWVTVGYVLGWLLLWGPVSEAYSQQRVAPAVVNVVALMVEFQPDSSRFTTGNGTFQGPLFSGVEAPRLDPLPHDAAYFSSHLRFLEHYIAKVSDGRTNLTSFVLPNIVRVSHEMGYYSPTGKDAGDDSELVKLASLVKEAWTIAEAQNVQLPSGISSTNTAFMLFHAGVGRDIELLGTTLDKTPEDLPSLFLGSDTLNRLGVGTLMVDGVSIHNTLIIPRTESRLGFDFIAEKPFLVELSINGLIAASFMNYLGVPDLFNTKTGESAIGPFDVMDALGIFAFGGLFPPEPSAWTKQYVGWADVTTYQDTSNRAATLRYGGDPGRNEVAKVLISDNEYFLLENRHRDPENDGIKMQVWKDGVTNEVVFPNADPVFNDVTISGFEGGVVVGVDQYDFALPGGEDEFGNPLLGGLLIWHVDENRINAGILTNSVNSDPLARGLDLEEADSGQDIGFSSNGGLFGPRFDLGSPFDFWFESNPVTVRTNLGRDIKLYENRFASDTYPSSLANNGSSSSVSITEISDPRVDMSFVIDQKESAFWNAESQEILPLTHEFIQKNTLVGRLGPSPQNSTERVPFVFGKAENGTYGIYAEQWLLEDLEAVRPVAGPFGVVAVTQTSLVWIDPDGLIQSVEIGPPGGLLRTTSNLSWYQEGEQLHVRLGVMLGTGPAIVNGSFGTNSPMSATLEAVSAPVVRIVQRNRTSAAAFLLMGDTLVDELTGTNVVLQLPTAAPGDLAGASPFDLSVDANGWLVAFTDRNTSSVHMVHQSGETYEAFFTDCVPGNALISDLTSNGKGDVLVGCGSAIYGYYGNGVLIGGFPFQLKGKAISELTVAEEGASKLRYVVVQTDLGNLDGFTFGDRVQRIEGFPLSIGSPSEIAPFVWGGHMLTLSGNGTLKTWTAQSTLDLTSRNVIGLDLANYSVSPSPPGSSSGTRLLEPAETYNWPNPISESKTHIRFMTAETADVTVTIIDTVGQLVEKFDSVTSIGGLPTEIVWNTSVGSGIYIARVQARSVGSGRSDTRLIKMAVVR